MSDAPAVTAAPPRRRRLTARRVGVALLALMVAVVVYRWWTRYGPAEPREIFQGLVYGCDVMADDSRTHGLVHWVRVDLTAPGVDLFATPKNPEAMAAGWEYKLAYVNQTVRANRLAVAVNGTLFGRSWYLPLPGVMGRAAETVVAAHEVNHFDHNSFLIWFADDLTPHVEKTRGPTPAMTASARWGISGNQLSFYDGVVNRSIGNGKADHRTLVAVNPSRRLLWLAVFDHATDKRAAEEMLRLGATDGIEVDGGSSTEMAIGPDAVGVRPGSIIGSWVASADHFGVQAKPLER